ncbi:CinA family protein [Campylobacter corcagiensis]|uniref:CinA family protein n=1 Tax=Campylobacter corcagiensis TaxID=1448857 RepID=A0A7M1LGC2_9BACT|nr:CinA family protein [Campylobacter corcagiensis]QKF64330.1 NMN amidohydrolase [Campylobacter corcagiensis]QOQ87480.1 CinA family protein [Campylobacter corcagiensis]
MQELILIIGSDIKINGPFFNYILKDYVENFGSLADIKFIETGAEIFKILENLSLEYDKITAYASSENFPLIAKIIASLTNDMLEIKDGFLTPTLAKKTSQKSFVITLNKALINLVEANPLDKLPKLLLDKSDDYTKFYIYGFEYESIKETFEELSSKFDMDIDITNYSKFIAFVKVKERKFGDMSSFLDECKTLFKNKIIFNKNLAEFVVTILKQKAQKISFAESCTAGLIASKIGEISGASDVFDGSVVTYANHIKNSWLGVSDEILQENGAVSKECVLKMLEGALKMSGADYALAVSGVAGPTGGSDEKPVGTVFIGAMRRDKNVIVKRFLFSGDRNYIREESTNVAFSLLFEVGEFFKEIE